MRPKGIIVSGYFNPIHKGHIELFNQAKNLGDYLFVIVNNDFQRSLKKSKEFMLEDERLLIVKSLQITDTVIVSIDDDRTVCKTLKKVVYKHLGLEDLVATVIERKGNVKKIILIEDYAKGIDSKNIEVVLVGQYLNFEYISQLEQKIEKLIGRKVSFYLASKFLSDKPHIIIFNKDEK